MMKMRSISEIINELKGDESQESFAERAGISQGLLSKILRKNYVPNMKIIQRIIANLEIQDTPIGQELLQCAMAAQPVPPGVAREGLMSGLMAVHSGIARLFHKHFEALLEGMPEPTLPMGEEEEVGVLVLSPIRTAVEPPFLFQWEHAGCLHHDRLEKPASYILTVKCEGQTWRKEIPASLARKIYSTQNGEEAEIISVSSSEPEFRFEELPKGCACTWEVQALSAQGEMMASSGEIRFRLFDPRMLSDLDFLLLGLLLESAELFDDAAGAYQKIADERQRNLALLVMFEKRAKRLEEEIERLESRGDKGKLDQLKRERAPLLRMVNIYRGKVRDLLKGE